MEPDSWVETGLVGGTVVAMLVLAMYLFFRREP